MVVVKGDIIIMKKAIAVCMAAMMTASLGVTAMAAAEGDITVVSREDGSGTRGAFVELLGIKADDVDNTTQAANITNSTAVMMTTVAGDANAIGYISLGSLDDSVTAVKVDGAEATAENIENGTYPVVRPFNIATKEDLSDAAADFVSYIMSDEGQAIIEENGYIPVESTGAYEATDASGDVTVAGSSSVTPVMEKLAEGYAEVNENVNIAVQQSDSTTGMQSTIDGLCDIGMASREVNEEEIAAGLTPTVIAQDGIAVIVNNESGVTELSSETIRQIYVGEITAWEDALAAPAAAEDAEAAEETEAAETEAVEETEATEAAE